MTLTIKNPEAPATAAQLSYLTSLVSQRDNQTVAERFRLMNTLGGVAKGQASEWINQLLASPKKVAKPAALTPSFHASGTVLDYAAKDASQAIQAFGAAMTATAQLTELPAFGYYSIDGTVYYWDVTGKDSYPVLRKLIISTTYSGAKKGSWKKVYGSYNDPKVTGTWAPFNGKSVLSEKTGQVRVPKVLAEAVMGFALPLTQDEAGKLGKQFGFCVRCGATLTDPVSVANGIGPVCAKYWA